MAPSIRITRVLTLVALAQAVGVAPAQVGYFYDPYIQNVPCPNGVTFGGAVLADFNSDGFIDVVMGGGKETCSASFDYAGPLSESVIIGNIAARFPGETLEFDGKALKFPKKPEANKYLTRSYRQGLAVKT